MYITTDLYVTVKSYIFIGIQIYSHLFHMTLFILHFCAYHGLLCANKMSYYALFCQELFLSIIIMLIIFHRMKTLEDDCNSTNMDEDVEIYTN